MTYTFDTKKSDFTIDETNGMYYKYINQYESAFNNKKLWNLGFRWTDIGSKIILTKL